MGYRIKPNVLRLTRYSPGKPIDELRRETGAKTVVKLASNENPLGPSPLAVQAMSRALADSHRYPDAGAYQLRAAIAERFAIPPGQIILGSGSDELLSLLAGVLLEPGDQVVMGSPSFIRYEAAARLFDAELVQVPLDAEMRHDLPAMLSACGDRTKLVFIANPNNPTGTIVPRDALAQFAANLPSQCVLVLDEAYFEFASDDPEFLDGLSLVRSGAPVVCLRTFSKAYGLAGIRLGYGFAPADIADAVDRARPPFNVNSLAQAAGLAALGDSAHLLATLANNRGQMPRIEAALQEFGARTYRSHANFVFADLGRPAAQLYERLLASGVIIRPCGAFGAPNCVRVTIGTQLETDAFMEALRRCAAEEAHA